MDRGSSACCLQPGVRRRRGRPPSADPGVTITVRVPASVLEAWVERGQANGRTARAEMQSWLTAAVRGDLG